MNNHIIISSLDIIQNIHEAIDSLAHLAQDSNHSNSKDVGIILGILHENLKEEHQVLLLNLEKPEVSLKVVK